MTDWIRANIDFGVPWKAFWVPLRRIHVDGLWFEISELRDDPETLAVKLADYVAQARPELAGCVVVAMRVFGGTMTAEITVVHPSLPPVKQFASPDPERLWRCPVCGGTINNVFCQAIIYHSDLDGRDMIVGQREVCSEECGKAPAPGDSSGRVINWDEETKPEGE